MSKIEVNTVDVQCGSTLTLGSCGKTVALASGASQSGFGRTGTVDWQTSSIKTSTFTAANGEGYFADTSSGAFTMNLPSATAGNIVSVADYTNTFQTNGLTISPNGSQKIGGVNANFLAGTEGQSLTFVYVDDTEGWKNVQDSTSNAVGNPNLTATGGTESTSGDYKIHKFTGPGTFTVTNASSTAANNIVSYAVVAGGASGGGSYGGGGGAGGFREYKGPADSYTASPLDGNPGGTAITVTAQAYPITVGAGGAAIPGSPASRGNSGNPSVFSTVTSTAGGGGGAGVGAPFSGLPGGSGGGAGRDETTNFGNGNTPPVSPAQGTNGGQPAGSSWNGGGGGGGATAAGGNGGGGSPGSETAGNGGTGATTCITASPVGYAGDGGGSNSRNNAPTGTASQGGGAGFNPGRAAVAGTTNTGGGGGGAHSCNASGAGGSGIVIIRYKYQ
jgi:hypothetical protein